MLRCSSSKSRPLPYISSAARFFGSAHAEGIAAIHKERVRQKSLFLAGKLPFDCASPVTDNRRKFLVLFEECGEVAEAVDKLEAAGRHGIAFATQHLTTELTQVAAVCVAWLESFEEVAR